MFWKMLSALWTNLNKLVTVIFMIINFTINIFIQNLITCIFNYINGKNIIIMKYNIIPYDITT